MSNSIKLLMSIFVFNFAKNLKKFPSKIKLKFFIHAENLNDAQNQMKLHLKNNLNEFVSIATLIAYDKVCDFMNINDDIIMEYLLKITHTVYEEIFDIIENMPMIEDKIIGQSIIIFGKLCQTIKFLDPQKYPKLIQDNNKIPGRHSFTINYSNNYLEKVNISIITDHLNATLNNTNYIPINYSIYDKMRDDYVEILRETLVTNGKIKLKPEGLINNIKDKFNNFLDNNFS
ncbi:putative ORFan [Cotonvirus japonicus]|uniref:ORFan n=1 Tax=Cotonvirus japonicus TaxID=2811091 RepID=A0ABM7NSJ9_9VIRU|nr:putative ORFan [Cotonvirus japonicus]BCS83086.1 putative ORFan [Cotonvirus japonicus]